MILFQWLDNIPLYHCMSLVHLSADGHLGSFRFLAFMIYVQVFVWAYIFVSLNSNSISDAQGTWLRTGGSGIEVSLGFQQQTHGSPVRSVSFSWSSLSDTAAQRRTPAGGSLQGPWLSRSLCTLLIATLKAFYVKRPDVSWPISHFGLFFLRVVSTALPCLPSQQS